MCAKVEILKRRTKIKDCGSHTPSGSAHPIWKPALHQEGMRECSGLAERGSEVLGPYCWVAVFIY